MDIVQTIALTMGVGWASGLNLYAAVLMLGLLSASGDIVLPEQLAVLSNPLILAAAGIMYCIEFFADKTPGIDTGWDAIHTFVRIPAGAILAMGAVGDVSPAAQFVALLVGGTLSATSHALKAGSRVMINTSPEPFSNWTASVSEDLLVIGGLWSALNHPGFFIVGMLVFLLLAAWLLPRIWTGIVKLKQRLLGILGAGKPQTAGALAQPADSTVTHRD